MRWGRWDFWPTFRSFFRCLHWKTSLFWFCRPLQLPVFRFFRKNKGGKIPLWVSVQLDVRLFYVSQFYGQSKSNSNVVCVGRLSTDGTPRRPCMTMLGETVLQFYRLVPMFHKSLISLRSRLGFWKLSCKLFSYGGFVFGFDRNLSRFFGFL